VHRTNGNDAALTAVEPGKLIHETTIPMRWGDMDAMGHLNNTVYFRFMEVLRLDWLQSLGVSIDPQGEGVVIVNASCTFHKELRFPGDVRARMYASNLGRSSFQTTVTMERIDAPGDVCATGAAKTVWIDWSTRRAKPLPAWLRAVLD
jgi:acyl-CoA thioester hydrolase